MKRTLIALAITIGAIVPQIGSATTPGFETGSCKYPAGEPHPGSGVVRHVPAQYPTIQAAVDAAAKGDTILIAPGTYKEEVLVTTSALRIRGESRTGVILDGESTRNIGIEVQADRVAVENLTVHNYIAHGVQWFKVTGFWGRYLTAYNMGLYGIFALGSRCGEFSDSYTSGNADSGFYIGECYPCDARIHDIRAEENGLGYSGTNAGGNLIIHDSVWTNNSLGIVPNSLDSEEQPPERGVTIEHNDVSNNNNITAPGTGFQALFWGVGIAIAGGQSASIIGNTVIDNAKAGIVLVPLPSDNVFIPAGNTIWGNTVTHNPSLTDAYDLAQGVGSGPNNCWAHNTFGNSAPPLIETIWACGPTVGTWLTPPGGDPRVEEGFVEGEAGLNGRDAQPWQTWPAPTCGAHPFACVGQPDDNGNTDYSDDGAVDGWLPDLASGLA